MCAVRVKMNTETAKWIRHYQTALRKCLKPSAEASLHRAQGLGCEAVSLGLQILDVARYHKQALAVLESSVQSSGSTMYESAERAKNFFAEVIVPIEATHRAALNAKVSIDRLTRTLRQRTVESSFSATQLERAITQRQAAEAALRKGADTYARLLAEAQGMQKHLQYQTREILSDQEDGRENTSRELRNEIAQALLAIDLSLLTLKTSAGVDIEKLEKKIVTAQRLVGQCIEGICEKEE